MGQDKARMLFAGQPLVTHMLDKLAALGLSATICGNRHDLAHLAPVFPDADFSGESRIGPLAGILAALESTDADLNLFFAVDIPGIPVDFLHWMIDRAERTQAEMTLPFVAGRAQPLCAVYHRNLAVGLRHCIESGERRVFPALCNAANLIDAFDVESVVASGAVRPPPPGYPHQWFRNLNTPQDFALYAAQPTSNILNKESDD